MDEHSWLEQLNQARKLYTTPHAVEILLHLGDSSYLPQAIPPGADPAQVTDAVQLLECLDLIRSQAASPPDTYPQASTTSRGRQLAALLSDADDVDRILLVTPCAAEILIGLRDGKLPAEAVPPDTDPLMVADAVTLLERLDLIH